MISTLHYISQQTADVSHAGHIMAACDAGCKWIQLRIKNEPPEKILPVAEKVKKICDQYQAALIINDFPHIAVAVEAAGVHVGLKDMTVAAAREITGPHMIVGGTANTAADIILHAANGASYTGLGPFRFTTTKQNLSPVLGIEGYSNIMQQLQQAGVTIPVIAIGGILLEDIPALMETGVHGIAASGLITHLQDREKSAMVQQIYQHTNKTFTWNHSS